jgi:hypothetical protein
MGHKYRDLSARRRDRPSVPIRATWSQTLDRYKARVRPSHVAIAAAGFAGVTAGVMWLWVQSAAESTSVAPSAARSGAPRSAAALSNAAVAPVSGPSEHERVSPQPATAPSLGEPVLRGGDLPAPVSSTTQSVHPSVQATVRAAKKVGPAPRRPADEQQPPASSSGTAPRPPEGAVDDPMRP